MKKMEVYQEQMEIGRRLQAIRKAKGFTPESMAERLGVSVSSYTKWESAVHGIPTKHLGSISKVLHVSLDLIMYGKTDIENISFDEYLSMVRLFSREGIENFIKTLELIEKLIQCADDKLLKKQ
jgi:transcriptional regulator with XRE-family HTH domain